MVLVDPVEPQSDSGLSNDSVRDIGLLPPENKVLGENEVMARSAHALDDWRAGHVALAASLARELLQHFNWPDPSIGLIQGQVAGLEKMARLLSGIQ